MYSPSSPVLSSLDRHSNGYLSQQHLQLGLAGYDSTGVSSCLKFKYFATFLLSTACLALLSASLATHKWIVSKPIRLLKLPGGQANMSSLILMDQSSQAASHSPQAQRHLPSALLSSLNALAEGAEQSSQNGRDPLRSLITQNNKFHGEIYFGLFQGVKVLNHGFGDRISHISVIQSLLTRDNNQQQEIISFKLWLATLTSVLLAILFALISSIFAIINFVMTPRGKVTGPIGLVIWNAAASIVSWLVEYFVRLQTNVLTLEEVQNGWTSENRSHFGYSYYFVSLAFVLQLVNIFIISLVHFQTWTSSAIGDGSLNGINKLASKRQSRPVCEGVIMLY